MRIVNCLFEFNLVIFNRFCLTLTFFLVSCQGLESSLKLRSTKLFRVHSKAAAVCLVSDSRTLQEQGQPIQPEEAKIKEWNSWNEKKNGDWGKSAQRLTCLLSSWLSRIALGLKSTMMTEACGCAIWGLLFEEWSGDVVSGLYHHNYSYLCLPHLSIINVWPQECCVPRHNNWRPFKLWEEISPQRNISFNNILKSQQLLHHG